MERRTHRSAAVSAVALTTAACLWTAQAPALAWTANIVDQNITSAGDISVSTSDDVFGPGDDINVGGTTSMHAGGRLTLNAADSLIVRAGTTLSGSSVRLDTSANDTDGLGDIYIAGTFFSSQVTATAGGGNNVITVDHPVTVDVGGGSTAQYPPILVDGGGGRDLLAVRTDGTDDPFLTIGTTNVAYNGRYSFTDAPSVVFNNVEELSTTAYLSLSVTDDHTVADAGDRVDYTVVATNNGPVGLSPVTVIDDLPATVTGVSWTCTASAGSTCGWSKGSGDLSSNVGLAAGGSATFRISGTISASASGTLVNSVSVTPPPMALDLDLSDNSATDSTHLRPRQSISFAPLSDREIGSSPIDVTATASSGLPVTFAATGDCTAGGSTVTLVSAGTCNVTASQPGDADWQPAPPVTRSFAIVRAATFLEVAPVAITTAPFGLTLGTASARLSSASGPAEGQPIAFTAAGAPVCTATTDATGVASCPVPLPSLLQVVLAGTLTATFEGSAVHLPATGTAPLVR